MPLRRDLPVDLPIGIPPVLPSVEKQFKEYIVGVENLPIYDHCHTQQHWHRTPQPKSLYHTELSPAGAKLKVVRNVATTEIIALVETPVHSEKGNGNPMLRAREPIWAGKFFDSEELYGNFTSEKLKLHSNDVNLSTTAPGLPYGIDFEDDGYTPIGRDQVDQKPHKKKTISECLNEIKETPDALVNLMELVQREGEQVKEWLANTKSHRVSDDNETPDELPIETEQENDVIPKEELPVLKIRDTVPLKDNKRQWAEIIDVSQPITDFHERVPFLAHKFDFELDTFQKQAVLKLEQKCDVFVAAHTSAGKTVVAEYAIALSMKHMTKSIYTSPIKALSNQKYRDFHRTFGDVGLITGDWKINENSSCLIMTTEILRSMLYSRSDVVPDLEYVIFDEVHYINDSDRGHVWEEVLIMLPPSVSIVMLSATVPNTLEFAQWVGRTREKKVHVITTPKRPVPLAHFLYTGTGGSSKNDRFLIMDSDEKFLKEGYFKAEDSRTKKPSSKPVPHGKGPPRKQYNWSFNQEKTMWNALVDHLKKRDELPVVAFTLSRHRCDKNAEELGNLDLTVGSERSKIDGFIRVCIQQLHEADRNLPQVLKLKDLLRRGIGVHHSGILPILKEIVEMLFQDGLVKLLFATETFAMGVNMPTRSVIFDSIRKFDGLDWRQLYPGEYIQMAGRAGRRGKDSTGNVLILCKGEIPPEADLRNMMTGKPTPLQSKFRLTYKMMLNLLRRENLRIEEMIARSFKESNTQEAKEKTLLELKKIDVELSKKGDLSVVEPHAKQCISYCKKFLSFLKDWDFYQNLVILKCYSKFLTPGRVVRVTHRQHCNKIGVYVCNASVSRELVHNVLVLCHANSNQDETEMAVEEAEACDDVSKVLSFAWPEKYFVPEGSGGHSLIQVKGKDILQVSNVILGIKDVNYIKSDWERRKIPRFKDSPPGQAFSQLLQDLSLLMHQVTIGDKTLKWLDPHQDMKVDDIDLVPELTHLQKVQLDLATDPCTKFASFEDEIKNVLSYLKLEQKKENLLFSMSYKSMTLYPDYINRLDVLRRLRYIDDHNTVELKGKVACEMSSHELMITEIVMDGLLTNLKAAEIAALLSCLVFQHNTDCEQSLTKTLEQGIEEMQRIHSRIVEVERSCRVGTEDPSCESENQLNFKLVQVVYEWAREKPFADIMQLTDVQEGIIVRCIQQLHETLQDVKRAARIYGDSNLSNKMDEASNAIKRDIVFSVSLYTKM